MPKSSPSTSTDQILFLLNRVSSDLLDIHLALLNRRHDVEIGQRDRFHDAEYSVESVQLAISKLKTFIFSLQD